MPDFPTSPYIVFGTVEVNSAAQSGITVTITNLTAGGSDTCTTDASGNYVYDDLANLPNGYQAGDTIQVSAVNTDKTFTAASTPEERQVDFILTNKDLTLDYDIFELLNKDNTLKYDIYELLNQDATIVYDIFEILNKDSTLVYDIFELLNKDSTIKYDIFELLSDDVTLVYDIIGTTTTLNKDLTVKYDIVNFAADIALVTISNKKIYNITIENKKIYNLEAENK